MNVSWEAPSKDLWNGNLLGYNVGYQEISDSSSAQSAPNNTSTYSMKAVDIGADFGGQTFIGGLNMFTTYSIIVQAFNSRGAGPFSEPTVGRTDEGSESISYMYRRWAACLIEPYSPLTPNHSYRDEKADVNTTTYFFFISRSTKFREQLT